MEMLEPEAKTRKAGIKSFRFTATGKNGSSHRENAAKKKRQHLSNMTRRAALYSTFQGEKGWKAGSADCAEWHSTLKALSQGTA